MIKKFVNPIKSFIFNLIKNKFFENLKSYVNFKIIINILIWTVYEIFILIKKVQLRYKYKNIQIKIILLYLKIWI